MHRLDPCGAMEEIDEGIPLNPHRCAKYLLCISEEPLAQNRVKKYPLVPMSEEYSSLLFVVLCFLLVCSCALPCSCSLFSSVVRVYVGTGGRALRRKSGIFPRSGLEAEAIPIKIPWLIEYDIIVTVISEDAHPDMSLDTLLVRVWVRACACVPVLAFHI